MARSLSEESPDESDVESNVESRGSSSEEPAAGQSDSPPEDHPRAGRPGHMSRHARDPLASALLAAALLLAPLVFVRLGGPSLWFDEVLTWIDAQRGDGNYNRLGYSLVRWVTEAVGGAPGGVPNEAALRFAPAVAGWAAVLLTAWAFRPLAGPRRAALAALVVAASPWQLYWGQNARFYTFVELTTLVGAGLALRGLASGSLLLLAAGLTAFAGAALFQLQALLVLAAFAGAAVVLRPELAAARGGAAPAPGRRARTNVLALRLGVAGLVLLVALLPAAREVFERYRHSKGSGSFGAVQHAVLSLGFTIGPGLGAAFLVGAASAWRSGRDGLFAAAVVLLGVGAVPLLGLFVTTTAQYAFAFLPWIALVAAWPVGGRSTGGTARGAPFSSTGAALSWTVLLVAPLLASSLLQLGPRQGDRPRWREAFDHVITRRAEGDLVLSLPGTMAEFYLARGRVAAGADVAWLEVALPTRGQELAGNLDQYSTRTHEGPAFDGRTVWLVVRTDYLMTWEESERARFTRFLREECELSARFPLRIEARDLDVEVWVTR